MSCMHQPSKTVEFYRDGLFAESAESCEACREIFLGGLEEGRRQFGVLLDQGWSREAANAEMIRRLESGEWS